MTPRLRITALLLVLPVLRAGVARAQRFEGSANVQQMTYKYKDDVGPDRLRGMFFGVSGAVYLGVVKLGLSGYTGQLSGGATLAPRSLRATTATLGFRPAPWIELGLEAQARREAVDTSVVLQRLAGPYSRLAFDLGTNGLQGTAELALYPAHSETNTDPLHVAMRAGIGVRYAPYTSPVMVELGYRLMRLDHRAPATGAVRLEQDEALVLSLGLHK
jgi:hypothetical protein